MVFAELWLPLIGAGICIAWAIGAWYGGNKFLSIWLAFGGVICLELLATLQVQHFVIGSEIKPDSADRAWIAIERVEIQHATILRPTNSGIRLKITLKNVGKTIATNVWVMAKCWIKNEIIPIGEAEKNFSTLVRTYQNGGATIFPEVPETYNIAVWNVDESMQDAIKSAGGPPPVLNMTIFVGISYQVKGLPGVRQTLRSYNALGIPMGARLGEQEISRSPSDPGVVD